MWVFALLPFIHQKHGHSIQTGHLALACLILFGITAGVGIVELGSWIYVKHVRPQHPTRWEFRAQRPEPYWDAPYFNTQFLIESGRSISGTFNEQDGVLQLRDMSGQYFNVKNGRRRTTDQPEDATSRILMFGGSTMFSQEVPDELTIASYLQRMLVRQDPKNSPTVINYGIPSMTAWQQLLILKKVPIDKNDVVIFFDGVNEVVQTIFNGVGSRSRGGAPEFRPVAKLGVLHRTMLALHRMLKGYSNAADVAFDIYSRGQIRTVSDSAILSENT